MAEGHDRDAMKEPQTLRTMEKFQRYLERDRDVGYSFSLTDILRTREHGVPRARAEVGRHPEQRARRRRRLFFIFFAELAADRDRRST